MYYCFMATDKGLMTEFGRILPTPHFLSGEICEVKAYLKSEGDGLLRILKVANDIITEMEYHEIHRHRRTHN